MRRWTWTTLTGSLSPSSARSVSVRGYLGEVNTALPAPARIFIAHHLLGYVSKGYRIVLHPGRKITAPGMTYTGEATAEKLEIAVGGPWQDWLGILVHETCHLDQHLEDPTVFNRADSALARVSAWLDRSTEDMDPHDFRTIAELESDCELRALEKIEQHGLPISREDYARRSNAYLLSYGVALRSRTWIPQPYNDASLCGKMDSSRIIPAAEALAQSPLVSDADFLRLASPAAPSVPPATQTGQSLEAPGLAG